MIRQYYKRTLSYSRSRFVFETTLLTIIGKFGIGLLGFTLYYWAYGSEPNYSLYTAELFYKDWKVISIIFLICIIPLFETFTQWLSISLLKTITNNYMLVILGSGTLFALLHYSYGVWNILVIFPLGIMLAWTFYCRQKYTLADAFITTFYVHAIHNMIAAFLTLI